MPVRTIVTIAVAVLLGLVAVFLVQTYLGRQRTADRTEAVIAGTTPVLVATQPIARGVKVTPQLVKSVRYPTSSVPAGAITSASQLTEGGDRLALRSFAPNEPILSARLTTPGGRVNLSAAMTPGMRAVTFRSNDVAGVAGFVLPGDRVDVLLTRAAGEGEQNTVTQVLAENVTVLGVDQVADDTADKPVVARAITLEVLPELAQKIRLGEAVGTVSLSLRQIGDQLPVGTRVATVSDLGGYRVAPVRASYSARESRPSTGAPTESTPSRKAGPEVHVTRGVVTSSYSVSN